MVEVSACFNDRPLHPSRSARWRVCKACFEWLGSGRRTERILECVDGFPVHAIHDFCETHMASKCRCCQSTSTARAGGHGALIFIFCEVPALSGIRRSRSPQGVGIHVPDQRHFGNVRRALDGLATHRAGIPLQAQGVAPASGQHPAWCQSPGARSSATAAASAADRSRRLPPAKARGPKTRAQAAKATAMIAQGVLEELRSLRCGGGSSC